MTEPRNPTRQDYIDLGLDPAVLDRMDAERAAGPTAEERKAAFEEAEIARKAIENRDAESDASREFREDALARIKAAQPFLDALHNAERAAGATQGRWPASTVLEVAVLQFASMPPHIATEHPIITAGNVLHRHLEKARQRYRAGLYADPFREVVRP